MQSLKHLLLLTVVLSLFVTYDSVAQERRTLSLEELFALAEEHSATIDTSRKAVAEAEAAVAEAKTGRYPEIELTLSASFLGNGTLTDRDFSNSMGVKMPHFGNNFAAEASQLIYGGGAVTNSIAMARLQEEMAAVNLDATRSRVHFMLTGFYLELAKMYAIMDVYDRNIALAEELIADTEARCREGMALTNDVTRHRLRLEQLKLARTEVENTTLILSSEIATTIGLDPATIIVPDAAVLELALSREGEAYWQDVASDSSHELRRGEIAVAMGERAEELARAERRPSVALVAVNHFDGPITIEVPVIDKNFNYWYVGVGVSFKLSSLYKTNRTIQRQERATEVSRSELSDLRDRKSLDVHADYIRYEEGYVAVDTYTTNVGLAKENYRIIETRYRNDMVLVTEMVDAANQLLEAELQLTIARIDVVMRYHKLLFTAGTI